MDDIAIGGLEYYVITFQRRYKKCNYNEGYYRSG